MFGTFDFNSLRFRFFCNNVIYKFFKSFGLHLFHLLTIVDNIITGFIQKINSNSIKTAKINRQNASLHTKS